MMSNRVVSMVLVAVVALSVLAGNARADNEKGTAVIKGKVKLEGVAKKPKAVPVKSDIVCQKAHPRGFIPAPGTIVYTKQDNAVPYVFVYVKKGIKGKYTAPETAVVLDQKGCMYSPHVFGMIAGQAIDVTNSDKTNHNVHSLPKKNTPFNFAQPQPGKRTLEGSKTFNKPEFGKGAVKIKCDVHPWMSAWCHVMKHPFFDVSKDHYECPKGQEAGRGTFEITELPAGQYELEAWHETFGMVTQSVSVADGETKEITFTFKRIAKAAAEPQTTGRTVVLTSTEKSAGGKGCCAEQGAGKKIADTKE